VRAQRGDEACGARARGGGERGAAPRHVAVLRHAGPELQPPFKSGY